MSINILMPALSPTMEKGNLSKWLKKEGDKIKSGDVLAEIETDKATMEVEAIDEGILAKIVVPAGTADVAVNQVIAVIASEGEDAGKIAAGSVAAAPATAPVVAISAAAAPAFAMPTAQPQPVVAGATAAASCRCTCSSSRARMLPMSAGEAKPGRPSGCRERKVVVAVDETEVPRLRELEKRGQANGLRGLRWHD